MHPDETLEVRIPIQLADGDRRITVTFPDTQITEAEWRHMLDTLGAIRPGLVPADGSR